MEYRRAHRILAGTLLLSALLICGPLFARANDGEKKNYNNDQVTVSWTDPAQFTEAKYGRQFRQPEPEIWLTDFQKLLVRRASAVLKAGEHLDVSITNVKLAGQVEPFHGSGATDVRVIKSIYPPEINLSFTLTGSDGQVLASGDRKLRDLAFLDRGSASRSEAYRFERRLLEDWVSTEFGKRSNR
ncbi:MAG: DUF3016 domain-containing protein [Xanthomonadales bacterium]|nr:DUF3016 domain-containing protein [Xanthomonadales bacterium]